VIEPQAGGTAPQSHPALVLATHGASARVRLDDGTEVQARAAGRRLQFVCGDHVLCVRDAAHAQWQLQSILPRRTELHRANRRGHAELVAANLDLLVVVVAPRPPPDLFLADRYLAAATSAGIGTLLLANKSDFPAGPEWQEGLASFALAGCATASCSARDGTGLADLRARMRDSTVMLVGQSGVGKSSLLRALVPDCEAPVGELMRDHSGRHTTSVARLHLLPDGGALIDAPGVRDFAPAPELLAAGSLGFPDVAAQAARCRFADCRHWREPGCAVRAAVEAGALDARRYESFRRLQRLREQLLARTAP
jgi:ribosome biogenesis GTPase